jgi:hypothetical protein
MHFEIHADNPERAIGFYRSVFGWKIERWGAGEPAYWLITTGPKESPGIDGGLLKRMGPPPTEMQPVNSYINTINVERLDDAATKVKAAGGRQVLDKMAIPGVGWLGYFKDTEGNIFGMMQADTKAK